jgi:hypothetical protein
VEASETFCPNLFDTSVDSVNMVAAVRQVPGKIWVVARGGSHTAFEIAVLQCYPEVMGKDEGIRKRCGKLYHYVRH